MNLYFDIFHYLSFRFQETMEILPPYFANISSCCSNLPWLSPHAWLHDLQYILMCFYNGGIYFGVSLFWVGDTSVYHADRA